MFSKSRFEKRAILSATSVLALMVGIGGSASACSSSGTITGPGTFAAFENFGTLDCVSITNNARISGNVTNSSTGVIGPSSSPVPATLSINNATISGAVQNSGQIFANHGTSGGISVTGGSVVTNGIVNNSTGTISVSGSGGNAFGIQVSQSAFSGGITNNGVIVVTNSAGSSTGLQVGGSSPPPPPPPPLAPITQSSVTNPTVTTTSNVPTSSPTSGGKRNHH